MIRTTALLVSIAASARFAFAQGYGPPPPPPPPPPGGGGPVAGETLDGPKLWGGGGIELLPSGSVNIVANGSNQGDVSLDTAFALVAVIDYRINPMFSVGGSPRYVMNLKSPGDTESASALDIRGRVMARFPVAPQIDVFGYGCLGYTTVLLPSSASSNGQPNPSGFSITAAGGAMYSINPRLMATAELGYTLGFEGASFMGTNVDYKVNLFHLGAGLAFALGQ
jgi:hypothetical protein